MPGWLLPAAVSAVSGVLQNRSAKREAERNRDFQERMSSSAAQRSVVDYARAGLNPALAYERPSSSPGGSVASVEDVGAKVVSSAMAARQLAANVELTKAQTAKVNNESELLEHDVGLRQVTQNGEPSWRDEQIAARVARLRDFAHQGRLQPHDERLRELQVILQREATKRAGFIGETFEDASAVRDFIRRGFSSAGEAKKALDAWAEALRARGRASGPRMKFREAPVPPSGGKSW